MMTDREFAALLDQIFAPWIVAQIKGETRLGRSSLQVVRKAVRLGLKEIEREQRDGRMQVAQFFAELDRS